MVKRWVWEFLNIVMVIGLLLPTSAWSQFNLVGDELDELILVNTEEGELNWTVYETTSGVLVARFNFGKEGSYPAMGYWMNPDGALPAYVHRTYNNTLQLVLQGGSEANLATIGAEIGRSIKGSLLVGEDIDQDGLSDAVVVRRGHPRRFLWLVSLNPFSLQRSSRRKFYFGEEPYIPMVLPYAQSGRFGLVSPQRETSSLSAKNKGTTRLPRIRTCSFKGRLTRTFRLPAEFDARLNTRPWVVPVSGNGHVIRFGALVRSSEDPLYPYQLLLSNKRGDIVSTLNLESPVVRFGSFNSVNSRDVSIIKNEGISLFSFSQDSFLRDLAVTLPASTFLQVNGVDFFIPSETNGFENELESVPNYTPHAVPTSPTPIPVPTLINSATPTATYTPTITVTNTITPTSFTATPTITPTPVPPFISEWKTDNYGGETNNNQIKLPLESTGTYNFNVNWGDGSSNVITTWNQAETTHTYSTAGTYTVTISGTIIGFRFANTGDKTKIINISQWGALRVGNNGSYFYGCSNLNATATDALNLTGTTTLFKMFYEATVFNGAIGSWDTSSITTMQDVFFKASSFNQDIGAWNTANVTTMQAMFFGATSFNQDISNWNTGNVTIFQQLFTNAFSFNQPIGNWNTANVTTMKNMFYGATSFNQDISNWNTAKITSMGLMFYEATSFNQPIGNWDTANVTTMENMFLSATSFNQPIGNWNVGNVTNMSSMFRSATSFNQDISNWNVGNVTNMSSMFRSATSFNQDIGNWNTANVTTMAGMFNGASSFNQNIGNWNTANVTTMASMFWSANSFNQNLSSWCVTKIASKPSNFDTTTTAWSGGTATRPQWGTCPTP